MTKIACSNCGGGLTLEDPNYGLVCEPCGVRVAGPFTDANEIPDYKRAIAADATEPGTVAATLEDQIAKILAMLLAAPSYQLNQTTIARKLGCRALQIGQALTAMRRRGLVERPITNPNIERPSAQTYRLTAAAIATK